MSDHRDIEEITADLRETGNCIALRTITPDDRQRFVRRFHELLAEKKRARRRQSRRCVYFVHAPAADLIKIGTTTSLETRMASLRLSSPIPLVLLATIPGGEDEERALHARWTHLRAHVEWFKASAELLADIARINRPVMDRRYA